MGKDSYPVQLIGELSEPPSRALWLVKWLLLIPHLVVLCFLVAAFVVLTIIAFFAVFFTARYPKKMFDFNVGVLRWSWRVFFYGYSALATDIYPPFTLDSVDYPADLQIEYPEDLKNWLVLFKWFLAIPHYAILGVLIGWGYTHAAETQYPSGGLLWILIVITAVLLLFTGKYHKDIFKLVMGINRWMYRVIAYVGLMTDRYPHFRLWE